MPKIGAQTVIGTKFHGRYKWNRLLRERNNGNQQQTLHMNWIWWSSFSSGLHKIHAKLYNCWQEVCFMFPFQYSPLFLYQSCNHLSFYLVAILVIAVEKRKRKKNYIQNWQRVIIQQTFNLCPWIYGVAQKECNTYIRSIISRKRGTEWKSCVHYCLYNSFPSKMTPRSLILMKAFWFYF